VKKPTVGLICCVVLVSAVCARAVLADVPEPMDSLARAKTVSKTADEWRRDAVGHSALGFAFMAAGASSIVGGFAWNSEAEKGKEAADKYPAGTAREQAREVADRYASHAKTQFLVGGGFLAAGILLNLVADKERNRAEQLELTPYIAPDKKQLGLALRF